MTVIEKRGVGAGGERGVNASTLTARHMPSIMVMFWGLRSRRDTAKLPIGSLNGNTLATNATHYGGYEELDVHNMFRLLEEKTTNFAVQSVLPGKYPFLMSKPTFSAGKWTGHWYMYLNIQGVLQFQIYQILMIGADTCGFNINTDEELCSRWMQLSAFMPFYKNHNTYGVLPQESYHWTSTGNGLFEVISLTPVLTPGATTVDVVFPGRGSVIWREWYTHAVVNAISRGNTTLDAPISYINVHIRDSSALLLPSKNLDTRSTRLTRAPSAPRIHQCSRHGVRY
ncbi:hypothetical protein K503DRAFT_783640 [Rhizopogon vinicolor AM-OR11-026]|uniref:Glycoside hydrolase family 31 protein n=1 Tax=Rhizopogon vinicolor AM-OR11-026 TaxID=1314800 RepID=A0A1B7MXT4_9AGAM|nr:hypothetical protein K503DRAFT_783640 [Rhizopogon vinicolor AM-OR11-026]